MTLLGQANLLKGGQYKNWLALLALSTLALAGLFRGCGTLKPVFAQVTAHYRHHGKVLLNDLDVTPGEVRTTHVKEVCSTTTSQFRNTTPKMKAEVCAAYGLKPHCYGRDTNEIDHLISLELGGADEITNLWPQPYDQHPGAHEKDAVENWLHRQVCTGKMELQEAQRLIASDWYMVYLQMQKEKP